jgi:hypothetical protein
MKHFAIVSMVMATLATGCGAAKSALGALGGGKPNQVTVVNNIAPPAVTVNVTAPAAAPAPVIAQAEPKHRQLKAAATGAFAGALVGGVVGFALDGKSGLGKGAAVGAGAGAVAGIAVR